MDKQAFFVAHNVACERKYIGQAYELHGTISKNLTRILRHAGNGIDMDAEKWADVEQVWNGFRSHRKKKGKLEQVILSIRSGLRRWVDRVYLSRYPP